MKTTWVFLCRLGFFLYLRLHLSRWKSQIYRWVFERKYLPYTVSAYSTFGELAGALTRLKWTGDEWWQLWDATSYPERVEYLVNHTDLPNQSVEQQGIDCDEFAVYIAHAVLASHRAGALLEATNPRILSVTWVQKNGKPGGHNVCLLEFPMERPERRFAYMDYSMPQHFASVDEVLQSVRALYGGEGAVSSGWALTDPLTLAPLEVHWR